MSTLSTFPNKFRSDGSTTKSNLTYSFAASVDLSQNTTRPPKLEGSKYLSVLVPNQIANVLFDITEYSFQGLYITKQKDIVDDINTSSHSLLIECKNYVLDNYLYISIPLLDHNEDTEINTLFSREGVVTLHDLNHYISLDDTYYSYKTTGVNNKMATFIFYTNAVLKIKPMTLSASDTPTTQDLPLSLSESPALKVSTLTTPYANNEIYINCEPVDETNSDKSVIVIKPTEQMNRFIQTGGSYFILFFLMFLIYKIIQKMRSNTSVSH